MAPLRGRSPPCPPRPVGDRGFSLVEIVVALGIIVFTLTGVLALIGGNYSRINVARDQTEAMLLVQEATTAVRNIARRDWSAIAAASVETEPGCDPWDCEYEKSKLVLTDDLYSLQSGEEVINTSPKTEFFRSITIMPAYRNADDDVVEQEDIEETHELDPDTYVVKIVVRWTNAVGSEVFISPTLLVTRWSRDSLTYDTKEEFLEEDEGKFHNTQAVRELFNGEVRAELVGNMVSPAIVGDEEVDELAGGSERVLEMLLGGDDLFIASAGTFRRYSLENVSAGPPVEIASATAIVNYLGLPINAGAFVSSLDFDSAYIYVSINSPFPAIPPIFGILNRAKFTEQNMTLNDVGEQFWDNLEGSNIERIVRDPKYNRLYVGRVTDPNALRFEFEALNISASLASGNAVIATHDDVPLRKDFNQTVHSIAFDANFLFVGTQSSRIYILDRESGQTLTTLDLPGQTQPILDIAVVDDSLYVGLDTGTGPELVKYLITTVQYNGADYPRLDRTAEREFPGSAQVSRVLPVSSKPWVIAVTGESANRLRFLDKATLADMEDDEENAVTVDMSDVNGKNVNGANCRGIAYEQDRLFFGCEAAAIGSPGNVTSNLYMIEDAAEPWGFPDYGSYTSPVRCAPEEHDTENFAWRHLAFTQEGLGIIDIRVRSGDPSSIEDGSWSTVPFHDDSYAWHDLGAALSGGQPGRCIQFKAFFNPSQYCPLSLQSVTMTYVH